MSNSATLKKEFLKKWIKGLHVYTSSHKGNMGILEQKRAIKLSADAAIASTRKATTHWSRALMEDLVSSSDEPSRILVQQILGHKSQLPASNNSSRNNNNNNLAIACSKRILRKSRITRVVPRRMKSSSDVVARRLVRSKMRVLKRLVPGGERMDERCLVRETLDYISSLRVQVDVMRYLVSAASKLEA
ncbi:sequence-specific DNA binding transcription factors [Striga hermonthica]|uniref:Sequence-specific DNA binding transcription factors n=1 Tax=Striga hermonthica TaxID=68872 RepID=A0A9N7RMQ7_STRHE|nr:sequence-specific DNA binding transcription factors [Striga hermonthica]